jgi:predicted permease
MNWIKQLFSRRRLYGDLSAEIQEHLAEKVEELVAGGMSREEATFAARREFGNVLLIEERSREVWQWAPLENLLMDVRYGVRMLRKNPGFTAVAVLTLGLGIGANTAIFSLVDQLLLWSLPAREPNRLVRIEGIYSSTYPFFCAYRDLNQVFSGVLASSENLDTGIRPTGAPAVELGHVEYVSGGYFQILGIGSAAGRVITPADDTASGASPVAVLSYRYWQRRFAGDLRVIGRKLAVNTYPLIIVGVAEKGFGGLYNGNEPDAFIPLAMYQATTPSAARLWNTTQMYWLSTVARLKPGVSIEEAQAGMQVLWSQSVQTVNAAAPKGGFRVPPQADKLLLSPAARADSFIRYQKMLDPLKALAMGTALVLLIACANVASLLLARASQRWKETAVRLALGANRGRLIRQFLTESLLLATPGSVVGLGLAWFGIWALARAAILDPDFRLRLSLFVLVSCAGLIVLTVILFGLVPALRATRMTLGESIKEGGSATQTISRSRLSKALVTVQVAVSLMLLVAASLFIRTLRNLHHVDLGFQPENIALFDIDPTSLGYRGQRLRTFYDQLLDHARGVQGVRSAALSGEAPMTYHCRGGGISAERSESGPGDFTLFNPVSSGYFTTMGIPLLLGRDFGPADEPAVTLFDSPLAPLGRSSGGGGGPGMADASRVCIIDEWEARHLFGPANPVGRHLWHNEKAIEIVGVVKDVRGEMVTRPDQIGTVYEPSWPNGAEIRWLLVRFAGSPSPVISGIRRALQDQDPNVPLRVRVMEEYVNSHLTHERLVAYLSSIFGILALSLASVGLYGVLTFTVAQRTREIGIRISLGARQRDVVGMIFRESFLPVLVGVVIGSVAAFFWTIFFGSLLYRVDSFDPRSISVAVMVMLTAALIAAAIPTRRATRVDPMVALRYE